MDNIYNTIQTNIGEVPQLETVIQDGSYPISTIINAPFIEVTSVNGQTGDVLVNPIIQDFEPNYYYLKGSAITYNGALYYAKQTFTSGLTFDASDWDSPDFAQEQADWTQTNTSANSYIKNKPNLATVATSGQFSDLSGTSNVVEDANYVHTDNNYTDNDASKLSGIESNAEVNTIESITINGTTATPDANKNVSFDTTKLIVSTTDIGEGAPLDENTIYVVVSA